MTPENWIDLIISKTNQKFKCEIVLLLLHFVQIWTIYFRKPARKKRESKLGAVTLLVHMDIALYDNGIMKSPTHLLNLLKIGAVAINKQDSTITILPDTFVLKGNYILL